MRRCLNEELKRAIYNPMFLGALLIGIILSAVNVFEGFSRAEQIKQLTQDSLISGMQINKSCTGFSLFISWISLHSTGFGSSLFYFVLPILAAFPYGWSYSQDRRTGFFSQIVMRTGRHNFFLAKYMAVFISGGIVILIPILLDLLLNAMLLPDRVVRVSDMLLPVFDYSFAGNLLYTNRWLYAIVWCFLSFLWGGAFASMCFLPGTHLRIPAVTVLTPFILILGIDTLLGAVQEFLDINLFELHYLVRPGTTTYSPYWAVWAVLATVVVITATVAFRRIVCNELE